MRWLVMIGVMLQITLLNVLLLVADAGGVRARFDLDDPSGAPFPSNRSTVPDKAQNTGLRVNLPMPDCGARPSDCRDIDVINTLDGFNVQPRLSIPFDGPIDVTSVTSQTVFLVSLGSTRPRGARPGRIVGINQVVWDVATATLHAESDEILDQHTRYALIVTRGVRDADGHAVDAAAAFRRFRDVLNFGQTGHDRLLKRYRKDLLDALAAARAAGVARRDVVVASVFTTQSVTAALEKIRDQIKRAVPPPADLALGPGGTPSVYPLSALTDVVAMRQTATAPTFMSVGTPFPVLRAIAPGAVGTVAFGKYQSPNYLAAERSIPLVGTRRGAPEIQGIDEIFFNLILPAGLAPASGWPVAIYGHGSGDTKEGAFAVASTLASHGIATIVINAVGRGFGPLGTLRVLRGADTPITIPAGGRGIDSDGDGRITSTEGSLALTPRDIIRFRDSRVQTVVDWMQLVRVIQVGMDVDDDGVVDLDPSRVYFFGHSLGGISGGVLLAVEPDVPAGVLVAPGGPAHEQFRLSPLLRASLGALLAARTPSLINLSGTAFDENLPLRDQPPVVNTVPGAMAIQELLDNLEWVGQGGEVMPYGTYLRRAPLKGVEPKSVIIQFARGDRTLPNPTTTAILRAGDLADRATYYRFDLFLVNNPTTPAAFNDSHPFFFTVPPFVPLPPEVRAAANAVARGAQEQIAVFLASDGAEVIDPDGPQVLFETPIVLPLPEDAVFFP